MSEYEDTLKELGGFGPFQVRVFILVSMFETPLAWAMLLPVLLNGVPAWTCGTANATNMLQINNHTDNQTQSQHLNESHQTCSATGGVCEGIKFSDEYTSTVSEYLLVCDRDVIPNHITTIQMVGVLFGAFLTGQLADSFGRRKVLFLAYSLLLIFWFTSAFSPSWEVYAAIRFLVGACLGGTLVVNFVLPLEFVTPEWRTFCGCVGFWAVGLMVLALWGYLIKTWQTLVITTSVSSIFILQSWWFIPESPRWLLSKGRLKEAEDVLTAIAVFNKKSIPDFTKLGEYAARMQKRTEVPKYSYWHLFSTYKQTRASLLVMYGWFVAGSAYYGLSFSAGSLAGNRYLNIFLSGLVEIPALVFVLVVNNKLGRRKTVSGLMLLGGACCFSILFIDIGGKLESWSTAVVFLAMLGKAGITGGWAAVQVFSAETFPTVVRNIGVGACSVSARIGGIVAPQIMDMGRESKSVPFAVFGIFALLCGLLILLVPETSGVPLPDKLLGSDRNDHNDFTPVSMHNTHNSDDTSVDIPLKTRNDGSHDSVVL